jgi:hypothetical protein
MDAEQTRLNAMRASEAVSQQASKAVNAKLDAQLANASNTAMANVAAESQAQTERMLQALAYNRALDLNEVEAAQSANRTDQTLARIEAVNAQSTALHAQANGMQQHFNARVEYGQQSAADALQRGLNRGAYAASKNHQSPDLMADVDVEGYINFRQEQRDAYEQSWVGKTKSAVSDFSATISDMVGSSYDFYFGDNGAFEKAFDVTTNALNKWAQGFIPESGGYTFAYGGAVAGDAGLSGSAAKGGYLSIDINRGELSFGDYWSSQAGSTVGIPGVDAGIELTVFNSPDFTGALDGMFNATGGQAGAGASFAYEKITTMPSPGSTIIHGSQITIGVTTPTAEVHTQFGYGEYYNNTTLKFAEVPQYLWERLSK